MCPGVNIAALQKEPKFQLVSVSSWQEGAPGVCVVDSVMDSPKPPQIPFIISVQPAPAVPLQAFQWTVPVGLLRPAILVEPLTISSEASRVWSLRFLFLQRLCCHWE